LKHGKAIFGPMILANFVDKTSCIDFPAPVHKVQGTPLSNSGNSLDPQDWGLLRSQGHEILDSVFDYIEGIRQRPVWQAAPQASAAQFQSPLPRGSQALMAAHKTIVDHILPYAVGNTHPGFMGWVHGGGTVVGILGELLAVGLNANLGGRDQIPINVEQQIVAWMRELFQFPQSASGLFVTGSSIANFIGLLVARTAKVGTGVRQSGLQALPQHLAAYTSTSAHGCIAQALEMAGMGSDCLRRIAVNDRHQIQLDDLQRAILEDENLGLTPFCLIGTAGSVDVGAIDNLQAMADLARRHQLWFHVDGACGALGALSPNIAKKLAGIELADSIALDFHKWAQVPYDAGFILVRDRQIHHDTFAAPAAYLRRESRGMAAGSPWPCDFGPDLSRSFKALKVWLTLQVYGADRIGEMMDQTCGLAQYLAQRISDQAGLELLAPVALNIVCFRFLSPLQEQSSPHCLDRLNAAIVVALQESGLVAPSSTFINGKLAIRAAIFNHRTTQHDIDQLIEATLRIGQNLTTNPESLP
jgi:aromatic-L-amino-acid/L-tryptophan decarboxylase